jgi:hypothetical protein
MKILARVFARLLPSTICLLLGAMTCNHVLMAQQTEKDHPSDATICTFEDGKQISARYNAVLVARSEGATTGKVWMPGGSAITLFTDTELAVGKTRIPTGAYTVYLIPGKKNWILIVSRNVVVQGRYDEKQDLVRAAMETGTLSEAEERLRVSFGHIGPKQCEMNVDYGKTRTWIEFKEN